ncbi:uncharacterized protein LOC62_06G007921 [Vanrija pseudolonga]|uniref:Uncharacterized protein n=1 Tax=Vanrija pseudolonga TaxID=143232 RepID=A0AAF0YCW4_9TREE|nr:hypothetical protein LOC62_06G007921 [Vanrija pseudolonga]
MGHEHHRGAYEEYQGYGQQIQPEHQAKLSHELISGAAAYEAAKAYEEHRARNGEPESHAKAKEILAGIAGAIVDREFETKGLDWLDREKAKRGAYENAATNPPHNFQASHDEYSKLGADTDKHKAKLSHELVAGAVAYEVAHKYEQHIAKNGQPDSNVKAKEVIAGLVGAVVDREFETKGLDWLEKKKIKAQAEKEAAAAYKV